jgi:general nucleoside transport system permease protein
MIEAGPVLVGFLGAAVRVATPLLLAATGETVTERAGVINLGLEGMMLAGALAATMGTTAAGPGAGIACAVLAGMVLAAGFALVTIGAGANQIIAGAAVTLGAVGLTGTIYRQVYGPGGAGLGLTTLQPVAIPGLYRVPLLGPVLFNQPLPTYIALAALPIIWWFLFRTGTGLALRATGEAASMARAAGVRTSLLRTLATVVGGAFAGLAGATLVLAQVGTFAEKMTAGRGYVAIAIVVLGGWHPLGVALASLLFGVATALQFLLQAMGLKLPYQLFLMLPYGLTLLALAGVVGRARAPGDLGKQ